jgi:hypothetical protein
MDSTAAGAWPVGAIPDVTGAILYTLVYADLFDYPLRVDEIHRYLTGYAASLAAVEEHLHRHGRLAEQLGSEDPYWFLAGREHLVGLRRQRETYSRALWRQAERYGRLMAALPFVRMVAVTGSLAMNNASGPDDDIDFLIVAAEHRVWLARGLAILIVHLAGRRGLELCPNYVVAEHHLALGEPSLFTAHEMAQLVPICGQQVYHRLLARNAWMATFLPNASPRPAMGRGRGGPRRLGQNLLEAALGGRLGDGLERWERERKIPRLRQIANERGAEGAVYTPDLCKGHADDHAAGIYQRYLARLAAQGL